MDVVVFPRRDRMVLAAVIEPAAEGSESLLVHSEDGARFPLDARAVIVRFDDLGEPAEGLVPHRWLRGLRQTAREAREIDWEAVHGAVREGEWLVFDEVALAAGCIDTLERLGLAVAAGRAAPWFRRKGARFHAVSVEEARREQVRVEARRRREEEDASLTAWWPARGEAERDDAVDRALGAVAAFALSGPGAATERGRRLAGRMECSEPDLALEALVAIGFLPPDLNPAPHRAGLASPFAVEARVEATARASAVVDRAGREDLRQVHTVAIDDAATIEVDDALSVRATDEGFELLVHIADVASAIPAGGPLDRAARVRASSLYLPEVTVPMLPLPLVQGALSLDVGEDRCAVTGIFGVDAEGRAAPARFVRSIVRVDRALGYEDADDPERLGATPPEGRALLAIGDRLQARRQGDGAVHLALESMKIAVRGSVPSIGVRRRRGPADQLVAETMVLYNRHVGAALARAGCGGIFRGQEPPRRPLPETTDPLAALSARRSLSPARTVHEPARHHGLAVEAYGQTTSPIRRYGDLVNQRLLLALLAGDRAPYDPADLEALAEHLSERERRIRAAAMAREAYWVARILEPQVGQTIHGVLIRPPRRGLGSVWVAPFCREFPLRAPKEWRAPEPGTEGSYTIARVRPYRGRVELAPVS